MHSFKHRFLYIVAGVVVSAVSVSSFGIDNLYVGTTSITGAARIGINTCNPYIVTLMTKEKASSAPRNTVLTLSDGVESFKSIFEGGKMKFYSDEFCTNQTNKLTIPKEGTTGAFYAQTKIPNDYIIKATTPGYRVNEFNLIALPQIDRNPRTTDGGTSTFALTSTVGAIDVTNLLSSTVASAKGDGVTDDTRAFNEAIRLASLATNTFPKGPTGAPQGVVYVPGDKTYRIRDVQFMDNVRMEIDAGAVIEQTPIKNNKNGLGFSLFVFGLSKDRGVPTRALTNVSLVGVGTSTIMGTLPKPATYLNWSINNSFTINVDPVSTGASQNLKPIRVLYANGVLLQNIFAIGNNSDPNNKFYNNQNNPGDGSNTESATIVIQNQTSQGGTSAFYGPTSVDVRNIYAIKAIHGYGAIQVQSGRTLSFKNIFSEGGIALRLESDVVGVDTLNAHSCVRGQNGGGGAGCTCGGTNPSCPLLYFSEMKDVVADTIQCLNGHAALSIVPHNQTNSGAKITNVSSDNCFDALELGGPGDPRLTPSGGFSNVSISGVIALGSNINGSGTKAQGTPNAFGIDEHGWAPNVAASRALCIPNKTTVPITSVGFCSIAGDFVPKGPACENTLQAQCISSSVLKRGIPSPSPLPKTVNTDS